MQDHISIEELQSGHWTEIKRIYQLGLATRNATFETIAPDWEAWDQSHRKDCRLVALSGDEIVGWAALSNYSSRKVYRGVAEVSIYIDPDSQGQGIGTLLMKQLISCSEENGTWTLQASVFPENKTSIRLHKKHGFRIVGIREKIARLDGIWRDVVLLERRSKVNGTD